MYPQTELERRFRRGVYWAAGIAFVFALVPLIFRPFASCPREQDREIRASQSYQSSDEHDAATFDNAAIEQNNKTADGQNHGWHSWFCEVSKELKLTDIALVFFTYCLVAVGLFTTRNDDENTKRAQRAHLIAGAPFGVPKKHANVDPWEREHRANASMFKGPWRLSLQNVGKTAAHTVKLEWGLCPRKKYPAAVRVSILITHPRYVDWWAKYRRGQTEVQDIFTPTDERPYQYRHVMFEDRDEFVDWVLFGMIQYKDVFGDPHFTTFSYHLTEAGYSDSIGVSLSDDFS